MPYDIAERLFTPTVAIYAIIPESYPPLFIPNGCPQNAYLCILTIIHHMRTATFCKRLSVAFLATASIVSCSKYDDSELWSEVNNIKDRVSDIEAQLSGMNQDIQAVHTLVNAISANIYIISVTPSDNGYEIVMSNGEHLTITNGRDGKDGADGKDGVDGVNGSTPIVGVAPVDGVYYWTVTVDGHTEFLLDANGNKIPTTTASEGGGSVAPAPIIKVDYYGFWVISYDGGVTFDYIRDTSGNPVKATGEGGSGLFQDVYQEGDYIVFVLSNGTVIRIKSCTCQPSSNKLEDDYITVEGANYVDQDMPASTTTQTINGFEMSSQVMNGAMNYISVNTTQSISKFFLGIKGVPGYLEYTPTNTGGSTNSYLIPVMISPNYTGDATMVVKARLTNGDVTSSVETTMSYIDTKPGAIEVKLAFSNSKDVDLHLYTPSGEHIYFAHRGGTYTTPSGEQITYGLDVDSNAGCHIDNINKENIYIPAELVESGTYRVVVNMYSNCNPSTATNWSIVTRYKGDIITPLSGSNPASGVYPVRSGDGDNTEVMTFKITDRQLMKGNNITSGSDRYTWKFTPVVPSWTDLEKMEAEQ